MFLEMQKVQHTYDKALNNPLIFNKPAAIKDIGTHYARLALQFGVATRTEDVPAARQVVAEVLMYSLRAANLLSQKLDELVPAATEPHWEGLEEHVGNFAVGLHEFDDLSGEGLKRIRAANLELVSWCRNAAARLHLPLPSLLIEGQAQMVQPA